MYSVVLHSAVFLRKYFSTLFKDLLYLHTKIIKTFFWTITPSAAFLMPSLFIDWIFKTAILLPILSTTCLWMKSAIAEGFLVYTHIHRESLLYAIGKFCIGQWGHFCTFGSSRFRFSSFENPLIFFQLWGMD